MFFASGTRLPAASTTVAMTKAASVPLALTWKAWPFGRTIAGSTVSTMWSAGPAVTCVSATGLPDASDTTRLLASRHCAVSLPAAQLTFQCAWRGSDVVVGPVSLPGSMFCGFGIWSAPCGWSLINSRTDGQLLNALTVTLPVRFQWYARCTTGLISNGVHAAW